jgi:4-amino-4-deoxy-L-arabinose transferase-like glycosyltransferase
MRKLKIQNSKLITILLLALALRLLLWAQPLHQPANDEVEYITVARDLLAGRGWIFYESYHWLRAPLYPLFLAASLWLAGGDLHLAALPTIGLSVLLVYIVYLLGKEIFVPLSQPDATMGGAVGTQPAVSLPPLLAAGLLTFITFASLYMAETLFATLFAACFLLLFRWRRHAARRRFDWRLLLAGLCFGLAVLTRSAPLFFLPFILGWIAWVAHRAAIADGARPGLMSAPFRASIPWLSWRSVPSVILFAATVAATIAPWTIRNCYAYGECILVETGLSYNLWAFSEPREDQATIFRTLESIPNPAERSAFATNKGLERLREDPAIVLRKLWPNWVYTWRIKPIQDRFLQESYRADPPPVLFLAALVFDDMLQFVIMVVGLATLGIAVLQRRPEAFLSALWIAYFVGVTMLTHGESRYRHFFFFLLIPYAGIGLAALLSLARTTFRVTSAPGKYAWFALACLPALFVGYTFLRAYPYDYAINGTMRSTQRLIGDTALARGDLPAAESAYRQALAAEPTPDGWIAMARLHAAQGEQELQADALRAARSLSLSYPLPHALLGDLFRRQGRDEEARQAFIGRYTAEQEMLKWSWNYVPPPAVNRVEVGDGLDFGYLAGFYNAEELAASRARWSGPQAHLRLPGDARIIRLRAAAPWPDEQLGSAQLCAAGHCQTIELRREWRTVTLLLPPAQGQLREVEIRSPGALAPDGRILGILIDWYETNRP